MESMNHRLFGLLGLALAALLCACGPTQPVKCQASNCSGCCTADDECLGFPKQAATACGTGGKECKACTPGWLCHQGRCLADPDAGLPNFDAGQPVQDAGQPDSGVSCGGNGEACCAGSTCYLGLGCLRGVCQPMGTDAGPPCGALGQACCGTGTACQSPLTCQSGTCKVPTTMDAGTMDAGSLKPLGEPCTVSTECADGLCQVLGFTGGYCTKNCTSQSNCPSGSQCSANPTGGTSLCLKNCSQPGSAPGGCRTGYVCDQRVSMSGQPVCTPGCASVTTCGAAPTCDSRGFCCGASGYACCEGTMCGTGAACTSGYCRAVVCGAQGQACCANNSCNTNLVCSNNQCTTCGGSGQPCCSGNTCTTGTCNNGTCQVASASPTGSPCTDYSQCVGNVCIQQLGNLWPSGYCSDDCGSSTCAAGSHCTPYVVSGRSVCLKDCTYDGAAGGCRSGYVCEKNLVPSTPTQAMCLSACVSSAECPNVGGTNLACDNGFCCGAPGYRCCSGNTCPRGGSCGASLAGYCG